MLNLDFFLHRTLVRIADVARRGYKLNFVSATPNAVSQVQRAATALDQLTDVSDETLSLINDAFLKGPVGPLLLKAFWSHFRIKLPPASSRLLINPPAGVVVEGPAVTASFQPWLDGKYGVTQARFPSSIDLLNVPSENHGFFDDITIFWDFKVPVKGLVEYTMPGNTVTFIRPNLELHEAWMLFSELGRMSFASVIEALSEKFKLTPLVTSEPGNFQSRTFGVEVK